MQGKWTEARIADMPSLDESKNIYTEIGQMNKQESEIFLSPNRNV